MVRRVMVIGVSTLTAVGLGVTPAAAAPVGVFGSLDTFVEMRDGAYSFTGWRFADDGGPVSIHVYDTGPTRTVGTDLGIYRYPRPDVEAVYGRSGTGFEGSLNTVEKGSHRICVFAVAVRPTGSTPLLLGCRDFVAGRAPIGAIDGVTPQVIQGDQVLVGGWAFDPDEPRSPLPVHVYGPGTALSTGTRRADVAAVFPGVGPDQGFEAALSRGFVDDGSGRDSAAITVGRKQICAFAIGLGAGGDTLLGCRYVEVLPKVHSMLDTVTFPRLGQVAFSGWSYLAGEPSVAAVSRVEVRSIWWPEVFSGSSLDVPAAQPRPDVAAAFPGVGSDHGYTATTTEVLRPGLFDACVTARRPTVPRDVPDPWGVQTCGQFEMPNAQGFVDSVTLGEAGPGTATVRGWAIDPTNRSAPVTVEAGLRAVNTSPQTFVDAVPKQTAVDRPDVNAAFGVTGIHGFEIIVPVPAGFTGRARACVQVGVYASQPACFASFTERPVTIG